MKDEQKRCCICKNFPEVPHGDMDCFCECHSKRVYNDSKEGVTIQESAVEVIPDIQVRGFDYVRVETAKYLIEQAYKRGQEDEAIAHTKEDLNAYEEGKKDERARVMKKILHGSQFFSAGTELNNSQPLTNDCYLIDSNLLAKPKET